jgi:hypothetical protein
MAGTGGDFRSERHRAATVWEGFILMTATGEIVTYDTSTEQARYSMKPSEQLVPLRIDKLDALVSSASRVDRPQ